MDINKKEILDIFLKYTGKDLKEKEDYKIFGKELDMQPRELLEVYLSLEQKYNIKFDKQKVLEGEFDTLKNVFQMLINL